MEWIASSGLFVDFPSDIHEYRYMYTWIFPSRVMGTLGLPGHSTRYTVDTVGKRSPCVSCNERVVLSVDFATRKRMAFDHFHEDETRTPARARAHYWCWVDIPTSESSRWKQTTCFIGVVERFARGDTSGIRIPYTSRGLARKALTRNTLPNDMCENCCFVVSFQMSQPFMRFPLRKETRGGSDIQMRGEIVFHRYHEYLYVEPHIRPSLH